MDWFDKFWLSVMVLVFAGSLIGASWWLFDSKTIDKRFRVYGNGVNYGLAAVLVIALIRSFVLDSPPAPMADKMFGCFLTLCVSFFIPFYSFRGLVLKSVGIAVKNARDIERNG